MVEASNIEITSSTQPVMTTEDDHVPVNERVTEREGGGTRCPNSRCATLLWGTHPMFNNKIIFLRAGTLEESDKVVPDAHFFVRSKHPWVTIPEGVRTFDSFPAEDDAPLWSPEGNRRIEAVLKGD